ncbi:DUF4328 domain-containing protein [Flavobacterium sp.]|uniref:DUF4328 domain-containing protein n=1 Tax=Flavobacterium sp. TaxID=239 RepID=UPI0040472720
MTEEQFKVCKTCLNRKKGEVTPDAVCNIRGHQLEADATCNYYTKDASVVTGEQQKKLLIRPNADRAKYAMIMILIVLFLDAVSVYSSYLQLGLLNDLNEGFYVPEDVLSANDLREQIIAIVYFITMITSAVFFIQWFRRAYYNLQVRTGSCEHSDGWAAGSWFVPIISLFRPYQIMKELDTKTSKLIGKVTGNEVPTNGLVMGFWWALWIITNYIGNYIFKMAFKEETIENYISATTAEMINSLLGIPLAILAYFVIKNYADKEAELVKIESNNPTVE